MPRTYPGQAQEGRSVFALLRVLAVVGTIFAVLLVLLYSGYVGYTDLEPDEVEVGMHELIVDETGRRVDYGRSWAARRGGLWVMHFEGSPEEIGDAHGQLSGRQFRTIDDRVDEILDQRYRGFIESRAELMLLRWDYRAADASIDTAHRRELSALAASLPDDGESELNPYHRLFLYQCFFDLTQRLQDVFVEGSMFAVAPRPASGGLEAGNLILGRTLSIDFGPEFEADRTVSFYYPDGKYPFVSIGWAGLVGVVTGINARGIFVAANPARTDDARELDAVPLPLVLRKVLEEADTLEQAVAILDEAELRTAGVVLIGDGVQRTAVVMEVTPRSGAGADARLVRGDDEQVVWATDHMIREVFESDAHNERIRRTTSSGYRYDRLAELLANPGNFAPEDAVAVLRDRSGIDNVELGLGNRNALENLHTTSSIVVDATSMVLWVAEGPSTLGRYRAFDLRHLLGRQGSRPAPLEDFAADRLLYSEEYRDYQEALEGIEYARELLKLERPAEALAAARVSLALAPDIGELHRLLGDIERELDHPEEAKAHYRRYLELIPGRQRDQERVKGIIEELGG
ncbi:MAG TPA: C45 family autoproteolytic acyltransferase/hydrolase [Enhygromyxa sp.]|nr:C45 family autoproteolytic acyltransferase/hydrolase [Enhygromyxa sp.]